MACVHNQAQINALTAQIKEKHSQINNLNNNISKCKDIKNRHENFNDKINCVISNLEGNTVVAGVPYDNGKMTDCLNSSNDTIRDCDKIVLHSSNKILLLEYEISRLESTIASLQGNCSACSVVEDNKYRKG